MSNLAKTIGALPVLLAFGLSSLPLPAQVHRSGPIDLRFGVYTTDKPSAMWEQFLPLLKVVEEAMQKELGRSVAIEIKISNSYSNARSQLVRGEVDFVRFGPASYVLAKRENPRIQLMAMETKNGRKRFKGYVVVRASSPIKKLGDLRGRRFAFGDSNSTIGRFLAQKALVDVNIYAKDLRKYAYLGRHDKVFRAVQLRNFDAGAVKKGTFDKLNARVRGGSQRLRVLSSFDNVTKPWVVREGLPKKIYGALRRALLGLRDARALKSLKADGLQAASDDDYDVIRKSMLASRRFDGSLLRIDSTPPAPVKRPAPGKSPAPGKHPAPGK